VISQGGWPVFDPGSSGIADLYPYVVEIEYVIGDAESDPFGPEDPTVVMPAARLVERCRTSAALRSAK
jgi:hypothetical protein